MEVQGTESSRHLHNRSCSTYPEHLRSGGSFVGWAKSLIVMARSAAETPVALPSAASTVTEVYVVSRGSPLTITIGDSAGTPARAPLIAIHTNPLEWRITNPGQFAVAYTAAMTKSPSSFRSEASTTITGRPELISARVPLILLRPGYFTLACMFCIMVYLSYFILPCCCQVQSPTAQQFSI